MEVKKEKFSAFFKGKSFYAVLAVGTVVAFAIGIINTNMVSENDKQLAKNPSTEIVENVQQVEEENKLSENNMDSTDSAKMESKLLKENNKEEENEKKSEDNKKEEAGEQKIEKEELSDLIEETNQEVKKVEEAQIEEPTAEVLSQESQINELNFVEEDGLAWPVQEGKILLEYNMSKPIYFKTLGQYKCNSAIAIEAEENTEVFSSAKGIVTDISTTDETGVTLTASIGNDYELVYGQLSDVKVKVGQTIEKGTLLGTIAEPTKYYVEEGSNLYFQVLAGGEPINPLFLLN